MPVGAILVWTLLEWGSRPPPSLTEPAGDTVSLLGLTCLMATLIAFLLAWFARFFQFPFQRFLGLFSFLPFALPPYIVAFCWADFLDDAGPVQTLRREINLYDQASAYYFVPIRSLGGAAWVLFESRQGLSLKPRQKNLKRRAPRRALLFC